MGNASTLHKFFPKIYGREGVVDEPLLKIDADPKLIKRPKNFPYPEDIHPSWPEGFLPFPPVTWYSPITDI
jgi:hypothetical protein